MTERSRCEVVYKIETWPYARRCEEFVKWVTDHSYEGEFNRMKLCQTHASAFMDSFPDRLVTEYVEPQVSGD